jgi:hypothetical protein
MKFQEAIYYFKLGSTIKRKKWPSYDVFYINEKEVTKYALSKEDYLAEDWEIVHKIEEPGKTFPEVFEAFKEWKKIKRKNWRLCDSLSCNLNICVASVDDLLETDWEIIE